MSMGLYLVTLELRKEHTVGGASAQLALCVNAADQEISGNVSGARLEGTQFPQDFKGAVNGGYHDLQKDPTARVAMVHGRVVEATRGGPPSAHLTCFTAILRVNAQWVGKAQFLVGDAEYACEVTPLRVPEPAE